jgi:O-antigen ligase
MTAKLIAFYFSLLTSCRDWYHYSCINCFTIKNITTAILIIGFGLIIGFMQASLLTSADKFVKVAMLLSILPLFIFMPFKHELIMLALLFSLSLGTGVQVYDAMGDTLPPLRHFYLFKLSDILVFVLVFIRLGIIYLHRNGEFSIWQSRPIIFLMLWIVAIILSLFPAVDVTSSIIGSINYLRAFLIFFLVFHFIQKPEQINIIMLGLFATLLFQTLLIIIQQATQSIFLLLPGLDDALDTVDGIGFRPAGTMGHSSSFAKLTGLLLPAALAYAFFSKGILRIIGIIVWGMGAAALALTVSRSGLGSWLLTSALFPMGLYVFRIVAIRPMIPLFAVFFLVIIAAMGLVMAVAGDKISSRVKNDHGSSNTRAPMWAVARTIIAEHPMLGIGLFNYTAVHQKYDHTPEQISIILPLPVHNLYLLIMAETGILGITSFIGFMIMTLWWSLYCAHAPGLGTLARALHLGMALGLLTVFMQSYTGKGFIDHMVHLSVVVIYAAVSSKQWLMLKARERLKLIQAQPQEEMLMVEVDLAQNSPPRQRV